MEKILITGSQSFVGSNFKRYSKYIEIEEVSLFNYKAGIINFKDYTTVIHLVAIVHQTITISDEEYFKINHDLALKVARDAKNNGVRQFVFLSTIKVYGRYYQASGKWTEASNCLPEDAYGKSKYEAEIALRDLEDESFTVSIVRTPLVYGPGVKGNMKSIINLISGWSILPFKNTKNKRHFTSAKNLVAFIDRIIELKASGVYIAMDYKAISTSDLVILIAQSMKKKVILFHLPRFIISIGIQLFPTIFDRLFGSFEIDNSETLRKLDFKPPVSTEDGIREMVDSLILKD